MSWVLSLIAIVLFAFSPIIPLLVCEQLGIRVNEANSTLGVLPWLLFFTLPAGSVAVIVWLVSLIWWCLKSY
jgi:hypothetical protein